MKKLASILLIIVVMVSYTYQADTSAGTVGKDNIIQSVEIDNVIGTVYHAESKQCDSSPDITADGSKISGNASQLHWVALSRDLIRCPKRARLFSNKDHWRGAFAFGDTILVYHDNNKLIGKWVVKDCMNKRYDNRIDFLQDKETGFYGKWENITLTKNTKVKLLANS